MERERAVRPTGSRGPLGYLLDSTNPVSKNNPGLGTTLRSFPSSFRRTDSFWPLVAWEEVNSIPVPSHREHQVLEQTWEGSVGG